MKDHPTKRFPTLGCCGLDCGLCPRYYTVGNSRCPGCAGPDLFEKHPSCGYITCCVKKKGLEVCAQCDEFPCPKFESWLEDLEQYDSFLTHRKTRDNLDSIKTRGLEQFLEQQTERIHLLQRMLEEFDDGRSKSLYCIATTLLPIADIEKSLRSVQGQDDVKTKARLLRDSLNECAAKAGLELKLRKKEQ